MLLGAGFPPRLGLGQRQDRPGEAEAGARELEVGGGVPGKVPLAAEQLQALLGAARANITISGQNGPVTRQLAQTMFPNDPAPVVTEEDLGSLTPAPAKKP